MTTTALTPENVLLDRQADCFLVSLAETERPLKGLAARLDWRFRGAISSFIRSGAITGQEGELIYLPITHQKELFHLFLLGIGELNKTGQRQVKDTEPLKKLKANLKSLGLKSLGVSITDLGGLNESQLGKIFEGVSLCLVP